jgi:hypothetical protein
VLKNGNTLCENFRCRCLSTNAYQSTDAKWVFSLAPTRLNTHSLCIRWLGQVLPTYAVPYHKPDEWHITTGQDTLYGGQAESTKKGEMLLYILNNEILKELQKTSEYRQILTQTQYNRTPMRQHNYEEVNDKTNRRVKSYLETHRYIRQRTTI